MGSQGQQHTRHTKRLCAIFLIAVTGMLLFGEPTFGKAPIPGVVILDTIKNVRSLWSIEISKPSAKVVPMLVVKNIPVLSMSVNDQISSTVEKSLGLDIRKSRGWHDASI